MSGYKAAKTLVVLQDAGRQAQLMHLLHRFRYSHASDPRDRAYALFGLAVDVDQMPPPERRFSC